jgi:uncharacterized membrane protein
VDYALVKTLHVLSATVLFGTGLGTAYSLWSVNRTRDARAIAHVARQVVRADWLFTTPSAIFQPLSGAWLVQAAGWPWGGWVGASLVLYVVVAACWLPVVWLQLRMRDLAAAAARHDRPLPARYWRYARLWFWLGVPAFAAMVAVFALMVGKSP